MFTRAVRTATRFTFPYVGIRRRENGEVFSTIGAFVVLNAAGWIATSGHVFNEILGREQEAGTTAVGDSAPAEQPELCVDHVEIWAVPGFDRTKPRVVEALVNPLADIAIARLEPFDSGTFESFPVLRDSSREPIEQGMSACRLGYPFHDIQAGFDVDRHEFALPPNAFPVPGFALDAIVARFHRITAEDGSNSATFIETSTPGLRGQSGGPLLDTAGRVCGIQSHTTHLDLGFDARFQAGGEVVSERQFLNVGAAAHVGSLIGMLDESGVSYELG